VSLKYLHTMVRVTDIDASLDFYCNKLGLEEVHRIDAETGRFTLVFLSAPGDPHAQIELTHNWDPTTYEGGRHFFGLEALLTKPEKLLELVDNNEHVGILLDDVGLFHGLHQTVTAPAESGPQPRQRARVIPVI